MTASFPNPDAAPEPAPTGVPVLTPPTTTHTQDDRILAALSHAAIIVPGVGALAPIIIWATQKDKSRFVAFQSLQAAVYHIALVVFYFVLMGCYMLSAFAMLPMGIFADEYGSQPDLSGVVVLLPFLVMCVGLLVALAMVIYGIVAAALVLSGKDFRYILIGDWLAKRYAPSGG